MPTEKVTKGKPLEVENRDDAVTEDSQDVDDEDRTKDRENPPENLKIIDKFKR